MYLLRLLFPSACQAVHVHRCVVLAALAGFSLKWLLTLMLLAAAAAAAVCRLALVRCRAT
jgi:hypothetical protein